MAVMDYTVDTPSGIRKGTENIAPNLSLKTGTWTADGETSGIIVTGLSHIVAHGVNVDTGTVTSEVKSKPNVAADGSTAAEGTIGVVACATDNVGTWWAIGY